MTAKMLKDRKFSDSLAGATNRESERLGTLICRGDPWVALVAKRSRGGSETRPGDQCIERLQ